MRIPGLRPVIDVVLDHSAERKPSAGLAEAMAALMATLAALIGAADMIGGILGKLFGEAAAAWIPAIVLVTLLVLSVYIVTARERQRSSSGMLAVSPKSSYVYTFAQPLRQAAKVATVLFLFAAPWSLASTFVARTSLPNTIEGYIVDGQHGREGVANAMVRVFDQSGENLTKGTWYTDDQGFYQVVATRRVPRSATLQVDSRECGSLNLALTKQHETSRTGGIPIFHHVVECK